MKSTFYTDDHEAFRETVREFLRREVEPHYDDWEREGAVSREAWRAAGAAGIIGLGVPFCIWISYRIRPPKPEERRIHQGIEEARRRVDRRGW